MIHNVIHTDDCIAARNDERKALAEYESAYPNYCRKCGSEGGHTDYEFRGECHGIPASEQVYCYCPHCVDEGLCPRCGDGDTNFFSNDVIEGGLSLKCFACGWQEGDAGAPKVLDLYDCGCDAANQNFN